MARPRRHGIRKSALHPYGQLTRGERHPPLTTERLRLLANLCQKWLVDAEAADAEGRPAPLMPPPPAPEE